jgi:dTDP-4-dehydrorhamnose reductase
MKILITGANGLLGQKLVSLLISQKGLQVIATAHSKNRLPEKDRDKYRFAILDVTDRENVIDVVGDYQPDTIIHTAALTHVDECEQKQDDCMNLNVSAVSHLIEACETFQVHLIHLSTDFIFNGKEGPLSENATPDPVNFYGQSKLLSEQLLQKSKCDWSIVRTVLVYGVGLDNQSNIVLWVRKSLQDKKNINVVDDQWRTPTLVEDLAQGCFLIARKRALGIFNISGQDLLTPYQMALETAKEFHLDDSLITRATADTFQQPAKRPARTGFDITKARQELGYSPHSFKEGLKLVHKQLK